MGTAIKVENLSKAYQLGEIGTGTLSNDLKRWAYKIRGKEDPFLKIGETNDRTIKGESDIVWSLKDINFEIAQGDAVGIIGRNGAGKSTLLKILSRVTSPTTGSVKVKGRVASLLEVGTGFHPELSGRDNIFLNGAILGMRKAEIKKHFDAIVDFSGVERYIDTPVKRYSSGMYVRLAFAVAAHLESEILVVDEVLAVGDAEFQKKCLGKMNDVSKGEGRTVLFVSHNMYAIKKICKTGILLANGQFVSKGPSENIVNKYLASKISKDKIYKNWDQNSRPGDSNVKLKKAWLEHKNGNREFSYLSSEPIILKFDIDVLENNIKFLCGAILVNSEEVDVFHSHDVCSDFQNIIYPKGQLRVQLEIPSHFLNEGVYKITIACFTNNTQLIHFFEQEVLEFEVIDSPNEFTVKGNYNGVFPGIVRPKLKWLTQNLN